MRRCKVSEAAGALALIGQSGKVMAGAVVLGGAHAGPLVTSLGLLAPEYPKGIAGGLFVLCDGFFLRLGHLQSLISGRCLLV